MSAIHSRAARLILMGLTCLGLACGGRPRFSPSERPREYPAIEYGSPELTWEIKLSSPVSQLQALDEQALLVATHRGELYRLNLETGKREGRLWQPTRDAINSLMVAGATNTLYFANAQRRQLWAYDLERGKIRWKIKGPAISGAMVVYRDYLVTTGTGGEISAFNLTDGDRHWRRAIPGRIYSGAALWGDTLLVLSDQGILYAFDLEMIAAPASPDSASDPLLWRLELAVNALALMAPGPDLLVVVDSDGRLIAIEPQSGRIRFQTQLNGPLYSRPVVTAERIVVATAGGQVLGLGALDGEHVWEYAGEGLVKLPLMARREHPAVAIVVFARGQLAALDIMTGELHWNYGVEGPIQLAALTPQGLVFVRRYKWLQSIILVKNQREVSP